KKPIILDILSFMRLLDNSYDAPALYRVLSLPKFRLTHHELSTLLHFARQKTLSVFEALTPAQVLPEISQESRQKIRELQELIKHNSTLVKNSTAAEMLVQIIKDLDLEQKLKED